MIIFKCFKIPFIGKLMKLVDQRRCARDEVGHEYRLVEHSQPEIWRCLYCTKTYVKK